MHTAETELDTAIAAHQAIPARLPLAQLHPGQQVLDIETKLIHHAIRIAAFNTAQSLARAILTTTDYTRGDDEAHWAAPRFLDCGFRGFYAAGCEFMYSMRTSCGVR